MPWCPDTRGIELRIPNEELRMKRACPSNSDRLPTEPPGQSQSGTNSATVEYAMSFYVLKALGTGPFRFGVIRRRELSSIDESPELSTGTSGEFNRHRDEIFFSADRHVVEKPLEAKSRSLSGTPFFATLFDGTPQGWAFLGLMIFGALLVLMGLAVVIKGTPAGWIEVIFGLILIGVPVVLTANKRRLIHEQESRNRAEREEREARNRALLAGYSDALEQLRTTPNDESLRRVRIEREKLDMPYSMWRNTARATVLLVGFDALERFGPQRAKEIADLMDRASDAAGLVEEDATGVKREVYSTVLWHFLADDRLGRTQLPIVRALQEGLAIAPADVPVDTASEEQFEKLRGIDHRRVPRCETSMQLPAGEHCVYSTKATTDAAAVANVFVTNKRLLVDTDKRIQTALHNIDQVDVDADGATLTIQTIDFKRPLMLRVDQPIYIAAMLDLAASLDERPRGFA
jgi:hypothetical protein